MSDKERAATHHAYLDAMGIQVWQRRQLSQPVSQVSPSLPFPTPALESAPEPVAAPVDIPVPALPTGWAALEAEVVSCSSCELHQQRTNAVFGAGSRNAAWMFIGEAPGADEDQQGEPFVGKAGQLFDLMLNSVGLARQEVYITNIVKCRPPGNRDPHLAEAACCEQYLQRQIALIKPRIIIAVGRIAAHNLLKNDQAVGVLRGTQHSYGDNNIAVVVTYHPAYLLRAPQEKRKAWEDLLFARQLVDAS